MSNINAIKNRYKASFPDKKAVVDEFRQSLFDASSGMTELYEEIHADLHKLAGSLGMYGYDELALQARAGMKFAQQQDKQSLDESLVRLSMLFEEVS